MDAVGAHPIFFRSSIGQSQEMESSSMRPLPVLQSLDLKARIAIFTVALFVCAIWTLAHDLDQEVRDSVREVLVAQQLQTVGHVAASLDDAVRLRINALADTASMLNPDLMGNPDRLHVFLAERMPLKRFFNMGIFIISRQGIALADLPNLEGREGASFTEQDFFREVVASGKPAVGKPAMAGFAKTPVINIAVPIKDASNKVIGVLAGGNQIAGSDALSEILPSKFHLSGDIHVISPKDRLIVASSDATRIMQPDPATGIDKMYDRYRENYEGSGIAVNSQGVESLSSAKRAPTTGWLVIATLPTSIAFKPIESLRREIYEDAALASTTTAPRPNPANPTAPVRTRSA